MNRQEIIDSIQANHALLEEFSVKSLFVFGSIVRATRVRTVMWTCLGPRGKSNGIPRD
jgi:hypothetical protein